MPYRSKAIAFDVDGDSMASLRQALPEWEIQASNGATLASLTRDWSPAGVDLLVLGARADVADTLGLCRGLRSQVGRAHTPLLVLVSPTQETLVRAALDAGAYCCLVLPVHTKDLASSVARAGAGNRPGRHTLGLDRAQREDPWQDDGGES